MDDRDQNRDRTVTKTVTTFSPQSRVAEKWGVRGLTIL